MRLTKKILQDLKDKKIQLKNLSFRHFIDSNDKLNVENALNLLNENICSFNELVNKFKEMREFCSLIENEELAEKLVEIDRLDVESLKYSLSMVNKFYEMSALCDNFSLIKYMLKEFVFDKTVVEKLNMLVERDLHLWHYGNNTISSIFDYIEYRVAHFQKTQFRLPENLVDKELLKLNALNRFVFDIDEVHQKLLIELIKDNEIAKNRLLQIIDNNLESNYDFESLMVYLQKQEKKNILNI